MTQGVCNSPLTAGSFALLGAKVPRDAFVAKKLRAAGAIILGKANLSQWANFRSNVTSNGWSAHGGQVLAAYYPMQDPSGSSSGSGVATSLGLALAALGTEVRICRLFRPAMELTRSPDGRIDCLTIVEEQSGGH